MCSIFGFEWGSENNNTILHFIVRSFEHQVVSSSSMKSSIIYHSTNRCHKLIRTCGIANSSKPYIFGNFYTGRRGHCLILLPYCGKSKLSLGPIDCSVSPNGSSAAKINPVHFT